MFGVSNDDADGFGHPIHFLVIWVAKNPILGLAILHMRVSNIFALGQAEQFCTDLTDGQLLYSTELYNCS